MNSLNPTQPKGQRPELRTSIPGPKSRALRAREDEHLAPGLQNFALLAGIVVDQARGSTVTDVDGNTLLDLIGGIGVNGLGHSHPRWVKAVQDQAARASVGSFTSEARVRFFEALARNRPSESLHRAQLYSSGAEAVESALRLAKAATGNSKFAHFHGSFHGKTMGVLSLMGSDFKKGFGPFVPGAIELPYANPYRPILGATAANCAEIALERARKILKREAGGDLAAILIEPMQGTAGNVIPPESFLRGVRELANEFGALLLADEMITGFGRTGKFWGIQHAGVEPDLITLGKQFGGGFPVSAVLSRDSIVQAKPWSNPSGSSSSYGGNPLASAAAAESIAIIEDEGLVENSRIEGEIFLRKLKPLEEKFPFVGEVRGQGLFLAIEFVKDRRTKEPLSKDACQAIFKACLERGLLTMSYTASFRMQPAMTADEATLSTCADILEEALGAVEREGTWKR